MNRFLILLIFSLLFSLYASATTIVGKVVDSNQAPLSLVNISIKLQSDTSVIYGAISSSDGLFEVLNVPSNSYIAEATIIGYTSFRKRINVSNSEKMDLGTITLKTDALFLDAVEVTGQASQMRFDIDKKVFNVDQNLAAAGASVSEVLENIPSIEVDNEGNVSLRNNSSVEVWINGKPSGLTEENRAQILQQMPAGSIEAVEIITNPSAKHNPEGTAGVINLVMKKNRQAGYFGSLSAGGNYQMNGKLSGNIGANINYTSSLLDAYANIGLRQRNRNGNSYIDRYTFAPNTNRTDTLSQIYQDNTNSHESWGFFGRAGLDFHINKKNSLGISGMFDFNNNNRTELIDYTTRRFANNATALYNQQAFSKGERLSYNLTLDYLHQFDSKGLELRLSGSYGQFSNENNGTYNQSVTSGIASAYKQSQFSGSSNKNSEFKADYTLKIKDNMKFEAGASINWQDRFSSSQIWQGLEQLPDSLDDYNDFTYKELITAAYATYGAKIGKFSIQAGLRGEYATMEVGTRQTDTDPFMTSNKNYFELYPTAFLSYQLPNQNELQLNYTRRVNRPRGRQLSAYRDVADSTNISYGNPNLNPEFANAMELNYIKSWEKHVLSASIYYRYTTDIIQRVRFQSATNPNVMESTYENIAKSQSAGLELVGRNSLAKWLNLTTTINVYYQQMDPIIYNDILLQDKNTAFALNTRIMGNFILGKGFTGQLTAHYNTPRVIAQGSSKAMYGMDLGIRKSLLNKALNINFTVRDVLNSRSWRNYTWGDTFWQDSNFMPSGPQFNLTVTYNFGNINNNNRNQDQRSLQERDNGMEEGEFE